MAVCFLFVWFYVTQAVGRAGGAVVVEVKDNLKKYLALWKKIGSFTGKLVDLLTKAAIKEMIVPSLLPVLSPIVLYLIILPIGGQVAALSSVGAMLGVIITGLFVAISMTAGVVHGIMQKNILKMEILVEKALKHIKQLLQEIRLVNDTKILLGQQ